MLIEQVSKQLRLVEHLHFVYRQFKSSDDGSQNTCPYAHTFFAVDIFWNIIRWHCGLLLSSIRVPAAVAQWVGALPRKRKVGCSNPSRDTPKL